MQSLGLPIVAVWLSLRRPQGQKGSSFAMRGSYRRLFTGAEVGDIGKKGRKALKPRTVRMFPKPRACGHFDILDDVCGVSAAFNDHVDQNRQTLFEHHDIRRLFRHVDCGVDRYRHRPRVEPLHQVDAIAEKPDGIPAALSTEITPIFERGSAFKKDHSCCRILEAWYGSSIRLRSRVAHPRPRD